MPTFTFDDFITWSAVLPDWQRDALRRVLSTGVTDADVSDLAAMAKAAQGFAATVAPQPATSSHIPPSSPSLPPVAILGIGNIQNANALAAGPVRFGPEGLTIVYGENGSGKSGLTRILKKGCRSRNPGGAIRAHVFEPDTGQPASATIEFRVGSADRSVAWTDGTSADDDLARVNVCDASCATVQVERSNQLAYTPEILRSFQGLADVCRKVAGELRREKAALDAARRPELATLQLRTDTPAGILVRNLSRETDLARLNALCEVTETNRIRRAELARALQDDTSAQTALLEARARHLRDLDDVLTRLERGLSDNALEDFETKLSTASTTGDAAARAREAFASNSALEGLGTDVWRQLWEAARRYSETHAFPGHPFPATHAEALCVLCQQPLAATASQRLQAFETFVREDVQQRADSAEREMRVTLAALDGVTCPLSGTVVRDTGLRGTPTGTAVKGFMVRAKLRRRYLLNKARGRARDASPAFAPRPDLSSLRQEVAEELTRLRAATQADERQRMQKELLELEDRLKLAPFRDLIAGEIERLRNVEMLTRAISDCDTARITRKEGEAARTVITARLKSAFQQNLSRLGFGSAPPVELALGVGEVGRHPYQLALVARADVPPGEVLSEGERTCVALAGFLAELDTTNNGSAIVLDDPVSSLDHRYRQNVARRLTEAARERQVIVFTHDIVFLLMLTKYARSAGIPIHQLNLQRGSTRHGIPEEGPPWIAVKVTKCIGVLRNELQTARARFNAGDRVTYEQKAEWIYKRLRQTWERAVEEVLLNGVVVRFGDAVHTQKLVADITPEDVRTVDTEMTYVSGYVHDEAGAVNVGIPDPSVIDSDILRLKTWVDAIQQRRRP